MKGMLRILALAPFSHASGPGGARGRRVGREARRAGHPAGVRREAPKPRRGDLGRDGGGRRAPSPRRSRSGRRRARSRSSGSRAQDERPVSDVIGSGRRHRLNGRAGDISKAVEVTFYDDFPGIAIVQAVYTNRGRGEIRVRSWTNGRYHRGRDAGRGRARLLVLPERLVREPSRLGPAAQDRLRPGQLPGDERLRLRRGHAGRGRVAARRRDRGGPRGARARGWSRSRSARPDGRHRIARGPLRDGSRPSGRARASRRCGPSSRSTAGDHFRTLATYRRLMARQGAALPDGAQVGLRADLVRLGLRSHLHDRPGPRQPAGREEARLRLGDARRRLAGGGRRLDARSPRSTRGATPT